MAWVTVSFNANGGTLHSQSPLYYATGTQDWWKAQDKSSQYAISSITKPTRQGFDFTGFFTSDDGTGTQVCNASGTLLANNLSSDVTVYAGWHPIFGDVVDYFGLATANLVPIESESGDNRKRVCVTNATWSGSPSKQTGGAGRYSSGVDSTSGIWRNPRVTYRVVGNMTLTLNLGKAFSGSSGISGYMITAAEVRTQIGEFPLVTVEGTANEGANAINLFAVSIPIAANAHAQNLLSAIGGSGELQVCTARASCDPVVCAENNMPCASDVVRGKIDVTGDIIMLDASAPTAGTGFTLVGNPKKTREGVFPEYTATVTKEIT